MPIKIPDDLPARAVLKREGVMVMSDAPRHGRTSVRCGSAC